MGRRPRFDGLRSVGIGVFFGSVVVNAILGIAALVAGDTNERVLGTSLAVTGALLLALACLPAWERRRLGPLPVVGALLGMAAFGLVVAGIWWGGDGETLGRVTGTAMAPAVGAALACVLAYPTLVGRFRPVLTVALVLIAIAVAMTVVAIWAEPESSWYPRTYGVVAVLLAATAVSIPVLSRLGHRAEPGAVTQAVEPVAFCPFCGAGVSAAATITCDSCGRAFSVHSLGR